jgi:hypothetical protein
MINRLGGRLPISYRDTGRQEATRHLARKIHGGRKIDAALEVIRPTTAQSPVG